MSPMDSAFINPPILIAFGNPLLDLCVKLSDDSILRQFGLADDSAREVTAPEYESLVRAVSRYPQDLCPGGAALNSLRVFQWLSGEEHCSAYFGSIGNDENGVILRNLVQESGVLTRLCKHPTLPTGTTVSLIHRNTRALVAHLGAASVYDIDNLKEVADLIRSANIVYIENFFFSHSSNVILEVVKICKKNGVAIAFNLSGSYLFVKIDEEIRTLISYADVLIGNESEYRALCEASGWNIEETTAIAEKLSMEGTQFPPNLAGHMKPLKMETLASCGKIVVITRGHLPVLCASQNKSVTIFETPVWSPEKGIQDTTGAGDAFAAGFLKGLFQGLTLQQCVYLGCYAAAEIIQQIGCKTPVYQPLGFCEVEKYFRRSGSHFPRQMCEIV